ncbi:MAG: helix-turn-helix domain-containing protein, partial [Clostridia bacterium]
MIPTSLGHTDRGFGVLLRELREQRGLPLRALGHPSTIHHYETGRQHPRTRSTVVKMAAVLNIDPGVLFDALGWPHRPISQEVQVVRTLIATDAAQAAQAAQAGLERALALGLMNEVYQWQLALADARRAVGPHPLPVDFRGRGDVDKWRVQATDLIQHDEWSSAVLLLESLLAYMPSSHPS